ncbi:hypothetical protein B0H19DRAFT_1238857 [Mycena capillaripes]|nr:hypothetical protein B0H19DRAFT_1238857 [Mycena capillaripes]
MGKFHPKNEFCEVVAKIGSGGKEREYGIGSDQYIKSAGVALAIDESTVSGVAGWPAVLDLSHATQYPRRTMVLLSTRRKDREANRSPSTHLPWFLGFQADAAEAVSRGSAPPAADPYAIPSRVDGGVLDGKEKVKAVHLLLGQRNDASEEIAAQTKEVEPRPDTWP